ncbi:MAG: hypothetical protein WEA58_09660 [Balneolaceae bacterium]
MKLANATFGFLSALLFIGLLFIPEISSSQSNDNVTRTEIREMVNTNCIPVRQTTETSGSPYLFDEFIDGAVVLANRKTTDVLPIRYNSYKQTLEFRDGNYAYEMNPDHVNAFEMYIDDTVYKFTKGYDARRLSNDEFVRLIIDDDVKFMVKHSTSFQEAVASYGSATQQDKYTSDESFYIKVGEGNVNRIRRLNKRLVMRNIDSHEREVRDFADENNIDFSDPDDVEDLLLHYNSLLEQSE